MRTNPCPCDSKIRKSCKNMIPNFFSLHVFFLMSSSSEELCLRWTSEDLDRTFILEQESDDGIFEMFVSIGSIKSTFDPEAPVTISFGSWYTQLASNALRPSSHSEHRVTAKLCHGSIAIDNVYLIDNRFVSLQPSSLKEHAKRSRGKFTIGRLRVWLPSVHWHQAINSDRLMNA